MATNFDFKGKVIAITGGASGIGLATAKLLSPAGAKLSLADVNEDALRKVVSELEAEGGEVIGVKVDVRDSNQVDSWIKQTVDKFGKLDGAVNLAGIIPKNINIDDVETLNNPDWQLTIDINLTGVMYSMRAEIPHMKEKGSIINAASLAGIAGFPKNAAYTAAKHGVIGLTRCAAKEVGDRSIRVNAIAP
jgi:NAD(P)-dependent dehydrogenase (short-subunit alcohol dehydrogenase family)